MVNKEEKRVFEILRLGCTKASKRNALGNSGTEVILQARNQDIFRAGEFSWNSDTSINIHL